MDITNIIKLLHPDGKRGEVDGDSNILANVDFKKDLLTTPKDLLRQFVFPSSLEKFEKMDLEFDISVSTTNEDLSNFMIDAIRKFKNEKDFEFDRRLETISTRSIRGFGFFFEQYSLPLTNLNDTQFQEIYKYFVEELKKNNPSYLSFVSKSDINKTITFTNNTKIIASNSLNTPLIVSYSQRGNGQIYFSSVVTSKAGNPIWTHIAKSLFNAVEKTGSNLVIDRGSNQQKILKSTFFREYELTEDDKRKEIEIGQILLSSDTIETFDNNTSRGSMSPNSSKKYVEDKNINENVLAVQKDGNEKIKDIINKESLIEPVEPKEPIIKEIEPVEPKEPIIKEDETLLSKVMDELEAMTSKELLAIDQAYERKKNEAKELSFKMLSDFKNNIVLGGTLQSNLEKINQSYRDNEYALTLFSVLVKTEILKSVAKDSIINKLNDNIGLLSSQFEKTKNKYETIISGHTSKIKNLEEQAVSILTEKNEIDAEFDEYVESATKSIEELRTQMDEANERLIDYEEIKKVDEERNIYIQALEEKTSILEKDNTVLRVQVSGHDTLKSLSDLQNKNINSLEKENNTLKNQLDLQGKTIKQLEETLEQIKQTNIKLEDELKKYDTKIEITDEIKKELRSTNKIAKELNKKEDRFAKNEKEINYLKVISDDEIKNKLFEVKDQSVEWHRLNFIKVGGVNPLTESWRVIKNKNPELYEQVVNTANDLLKAGLVYKTPEGTFKLREKSKNIIFENLSMTNEELATEFKAFTYQGTNNYGDSNNNNESHNKQYPTKIKLSNK